MIGELADSFELAAKGITQDLKDIFQHMTSGLTNGVPAPALALPVMQQMETSVPSASLHYNQNLRL